MLMSLVLEHRMSVCVCVCGWTDGSVLGTEDAGVALCCVA